MTVASRPSPAVHPDAALIVAMADAARAIARRYFRQDLGLMMKGDSSPVTLADKEIEASLREMLSRLAPEDGVYGEEMPPVGLSRSRLWVIDPIDGTGAFATGSPLFGVLLGLIEDGVPQFGLIDASATGERWVARRGHGATLDGSPCRASKATTLAGASVSATSIHAYGEAARAAFDRISAKAAITRLGGDCYAYGLLAAGHLDAVIETDLKPYDYMPLLPVIEEAGGVITDWDGEPLTLRSRGDVVAAATAELHDEILRTLRQG